MPALRSVVDRRVAGTVVRHAELTEALGDVSGGVGHLEMYTVNAAVAGALPLGAEFGMVCQTNSNMRSLDGGARPLIRTTASASYGPFESRCALLATRSPVVTALGGR